MQKTNAQKVSRQGDGGCLVRLHHDKTVSSLQVSLLVSNVLRTALGNALIALMTIEKVLLDTPSPSKTCQFLCDVTVNEGLRPTSLLREIFEQRQVVMQGLSGHQGNVLH